jgi:hypothetical protein
MKNAASFSLSILLPVVLAIVGCVSQNPSLEPIAGGLKAGVAEIDITPAIGYRMAGYFDERCSTGVHDRLHAKALVLQHGEEKIALVSCDLVGVPLSVSKAAREQSSAKYGITAKNIVICGTHSHTGPLYNDVRNTYFHQAAIAKYGFDPHQPEDYARILTERVVRVIGEACRRVAPATLSAGIGRREGISFNRRYHMENGKVAFNPGRLNPNIIRPAGPIDPDVGIVMVRNARGNPIAGLTVFAMHPDTVGGTKFSADYPHYIEQSLRAAFGKKYISLFGLGTCGDINHIDVSKRESVKGQDAAHQFGTALGETVLGSISNLNAVDCPKLAVASRTVMAALRDTTPEQVKEAKAKLPLIGTDKLGFDVKVEAVRILDLAERGKEWPLEVQVFRLDARTALVCLPCEIFVDFGLAIKKQSPFANTLIISICNDRPSYVPTRKAFAEGSYEISNSRVKPGVGEELVETALDLLKELAR